MRDPGRWVLGLALVAGLLTSLGPLSARWRAEAVNRRVELVADYTSFSRLAAARGMALADLLRRLGIEAVGLPEDSLSLWAEEGRAQVYSLGELRALRLPLPPEISPVEAEAFTFVFASPQDLSWLERRLEGRLPGVEWRRLSSSPGLAVRMGKEALVSLPLGFSQERLEPFSRAGIRVVPRIEPSPDPVGSLRDLQGARVSAVLFTGETLPGYPGREGEAAGELRRRGWLLGLVEKPDQLSNLHPRGMERMGRELPSVRFFSLQEWLLRRSPEQVVDAAVRAVEERNVRALYLRPLEKGITPLREVEENGRWLGELRRRLKDKGFTFGPPEPFPALEVGLFPSLLVSLGIGAGAGLLWRELFPGFSRLGPFFLLLAFLGLGGETGRHLAALGAAVVFPPLGLALFLSLFSRRFSLLPLALAGAALVALGGGLLLGGLLSDTAHLLEESYFRGVKLSFALPPLLGFLLYLRKEGLGFYESNGPGEAGAGGRGVGEELWRLGDCPLRFKHLAAVFLLLLALFLYLVRSGNVQASLTPGWELAVRDFLEGVLGVRPRTKEFLVGYPALALAWLCLERKERFLALFLSLLGIMAPVSVVNSFSHLRTPLEVSLWRSLHGFWMGLVLGGGGVILLRAALGRLRLLRLRESGG